MNSHAGTWQPPNITLITIYSFSFFKGFVNTYFQKCPTAVFASATDSGKAAYFPCATPLVCPAISSG
ncbi:MAG: hypothetical protein QME06_09790, partial [Desulfobacterales bacterium]|nr:hypothetical protein [Desulfobacterales bacterium]